MLGKPRFEKLLSPFGIKQVKLKNRIVKTSAAMGLASEDGYITDGNLSFYETRAKGGVGLIIVEHGFVDYPMGVTGPRRIAISDDKFIPGLRKLAQVIHKYETPCFQQLGHSGPLQKWLLTPGQRPVTCSSSTEKGPRELSLSEIEELVEKYGKAAERARESGFDGVEVHAAASYLINTFMSRAWNKRKDAYGCQDLRSRSRFLVEILQAVRKRVGESFVVGVRINGAELGIEDGITSKESQDFAKILQEASADYICMQARGFGPYELLGFPEQIQYPEPMVDLAKKIRKPGALVPLGEAIKQAVTIPIIAVGRLDATLGEWILKKGKADLIGINRRLFADPEYPNKVTAGRLEEIAPCTACMECWASQQAGDRMRCRINPALGRESELVIKPAEQKKKVVIVGGGPAGMEAARLSAMRGHEVVLYEKRNSLGGLLPLAALIKGSQIEDLPAIVSYLKTHLKKLGVQIRLGAEVNIALIEEVKPDVVIIGSGGIPDVPDIPGMNNHNVVSSITLHRAAQRYLRFVSPKILRWLTRFYLPIGRTVIIVGGLMHGCELAEFLVKRGRKVIVLETSDQLGKGIHEINRPRLLRWLTQKGVVMLTGVKYEKVYDRGLSIVTKEGKRETIDADTIVLATPPRPDTELFNTLKDKGKEVYLIGDSKEPRTIVDAIGDGSQIGRTI